MVGMRGMKTLVSALLVMMFASIMGGFAPVGTAQTEVSSSASCGVDLVAMLESAVNSALYTLIKLNVSADSVSWSLIMEANASVEAIAQAQASGQCTTALELYLNATKKIAEALSIAKKEAAQSAKLMEAQASLYAEISAEIRAAIDLSTEIEKAYEKGLINASIKAQLEAEVNASLDALIELEVKVNASIEAGNLTVEAIQSFKAELQQIKTDLKLTAEKLHEAIAEFYKSKIKAEVELKLHEAMEKMQKLQQKLEEKGVCEDMPEVCTAINQSIEELMNLTNSLNQSMSTNASAMVAMAMAAHAKIAVEGIYKAVTNVSAEVNASIELKEAYMNASAKLDELKQALIDLRNEMAARFMSTYQIEMLIRGIDNLKEELNMVVRHSHRGCTDERDSMVSHGMEFFSNLRNIMIQLNQSIGADPVIRAKIDIVINKSISAEAAINATLELSINVSATFNETSKGKAEALLKKSIKIAASAERALMALGLEEQASAIAQAVGNLEAALRAINQGDNATAIQKIDAAVSVLINVRSQLGGESTVNACISAKISVSIELALSAKAGLQ